MAFFTTVGDYYCGPGVGKLYSSQGSIVFLQDEVHETLEFIKGPETIRLEKEDDETPVLKEVEVETVLPSAGLGSSRGGGVSSGAGVSSVVGVSSGEGVSSDGFKDFSSGGFPSRVHDATLIGQIICSAIESSSACDGKDKQTVKNLNDRLAIYLEKVRSLEQSSRDLEGKIREWHDKQEALVPTAAHQDLDHFYTTMEELRAKSEQLRKEVGANVEQMQSGKSEIVEIRRSLQGLDLELQTEFKRKKGLESPLADTEGGYSAQLHQMQSQISHYEAQLIDLRGNMEHQNLAYKALLDVKNRLEMKLTCTNSN